MDTKFNFKLGVYDRILIDIYLLKNNIPHGISNLIKLDDDRYEVISLFKGILNDIKNKKISVKEATEREEDVYKKITEILRKEISE